MHRLLFICTIMLLSCIQGIFYGEPQDFYKNGVSYIWEDAANYSEAKKVFVDAFGACYEQIPLDVLQQPSRASMYQWLEAAFEEIYANYHHSASTLWLSAKVGDKVVGCLLIDVSNYPEEIYLAQLAVDPLYQGQGIASSMIRSLCDQFLGCKKLVVITRRANKEALGLYAALGFAPSSYMHEGYSREFFTGFEYVNPHAIYEE